MSEANPGFAEGGGPWPASACGSSGDHPVHPHLDLPIINVSFTSTLDTICPSSLTGWLGGAVVSVSDS